MTFDVPARITNALTPVGHINRGLFHGGAALYVMSDLFLGGSINTLCAGAMGLGLGLSTLLTLALAYRYRVRA